MTSYPVHYSVDRPERFTRIQLVVRLLAFIALGLFGLSFATIFLFAYLALPVFAAIRLSGAGSSAYLDGDGPRVVRGLHWLAAITAWAGLVTEQLPSRQPDETIRLEVARTAVAPTARDAILRVFTGLPSALVLMLLCFIGSFVWLWAAATVLISERVGAGAHGYLVGLQRWSVRLLAYQSALVDDYPPFSFTDRAPSLPHARATG